MEVNNLVNNVFQAKVKSEPDNFDYEDIDIKTELIDDHLTSEERDICSMTSGSFLNTCNVCKEHFDDHYLLVTHMNKFHARPFIKTETNINVNTDTMAMESGNYTLKDTLKKEQLVNNAISVHKTLSSGRIACDFCGIKYKNRENLIKHQQKTNCNQQEPIRTMHCGTCGISFSSRINLSRHQARTGCVQNEDKGSSDDTDIEQFPGLKQDILAKRLPNRFYCDTCGLSYKNRSNLIRHQKKSGCRQKKQRQVQEADLHDAIFQMGINSFIKAEEPSYPPYTQSNNSHAIKNETVSGNVVSPQNIANHFTHNTKTETPMQEFISNPENTGFHTLAASHNHLEPQEHSETPKAEIICDICNRSFENIKRLYAHADAHDRVPTVLQGDADFLKCKFCLKQFPSHIERREHEATHTGDKPYECLHCKKIFVRSRNLMQHIRIHTGELPFQCESCPKVFRDRRYLRRHIDRHHLLVERLACDLCSVKVYDKVQLALHRRTHIEGRTFACKQCGATKEIAEQKPFSKPEDTDTDCSDNSVENNGPSSLSDSDLQCDLCNRRFKEHEAFYTHADSHDTIPLSLKDDPDYLKCKYCYKEFTVLLDRKTHETTHRRKRPYQCQQCKLRFVSSLSRKIHMRIHTEQPVLQCDECCKTFKDKSGLKRHIKRKHLKIRKVECDLCVKKFFDRVELALHMLSHIKEDNYVCETCRK